MYLWFLLFLTACGASSPHGLRRDGQRAVEAMTQDLAELRSRQDIVWAKKRIQDDYGRIVDALIAMEKAGIKDPIPPKYARALRGELERLYSVSGAADLLESYQMPALSRFDAFMKKKHRNSRDGDLGLLGQ